MYRRPVKRKDEVPLDWEEIRSAFDYYLKFGRYLTKKQAKRLHEGEIITVHRGNVYWEIIEKLELVKDND